MGELVLIRHGQANSAANDEAGYDRLSDLGRQQARWLGDWLRAHEDPFDRVLLGSLRRHRETAEEMGDMGAEREVDARLNELDYFNLTRAHAARNGSVEPRTPEDFVKHIRDVMEAWFRAEIQGDESYASFEGRVAEILTIAARPGRRVLCVTSGGVIGMMVRHLLDLDPGRMAHLLVPIRNSSIHRVTVLPQGKILSGFNATPHLDAPDRLHARTEY
ncbi:histidine phosphatase family protein [Roseibacterium sp. SDUM158017]|uniref:histidine phosphatase family protein n=1 Tax=Roseicyclus salinarum TaxID=3036773 RepID=UPI0024156EEF|nr:histidine phosphatase family protein [Roseibacterium sp. SDUM158017]MDG4649423.1 histidine phosphatase family protein [Roseibacterium sp. SDUM158017]